MQEKYLHITEFARLAKTSRKALQYYDELGLFRPAYVAENGYRCYSLHQLDRLALIAVLRDMGLPLKEIKDYLSCGGGERLEALLEDQREEIDRLAGQLRRRQRLLTEIMEENRMFQSLCGRGFQLVEWPEQRAAWLADMAAGGRVVANYLTDGLHLGLCAHEGGEFLYQKREDGELLIPGGTFFCRCELVENGPQQRRQDWVERMGAAAAEQGLTLERRVYIEFNDLLLTQDGGRECMMRLIRSLVLPPQGGKTSRRAGK